MLTYSATGGKLGQERLNGGAIAQAVVVGVITNGVIQQRAARQNSVASKAKSNQVIAESSKSPGVSAATPKSGGHTQQPVVNSDLAARLTAFKAYKTNKGLASSDKVSRKQFGNFRRAGMGIL